MKKKSRTEYCCCINSSCERLSSRWKAGDCYNRGGRLVKDCSQCK